VVNFFSISKNKLLTMSARKPEQGVKLRGAEKVARIPIKVVRSTEVKRKPAWIRAKAPTTSEVKRLKKVLREQKLNTVCEEAACPNLGECFTKGTATFMIMGDICTRRCPFCDVGHGKPEPLNKAINTLDYDTLLKAVNTLKEKKALPVTTETFSQDEKIDTSRILFDSKNKKQLSSSAQMPLNNFAKQILSSLKTFDIIVSEQNSETALEQARVIRNYLVSRGVEKNRMNIIGRGSTQYKVQFRPSS